MEQKIINPAVEKTIRILNLLTESETALSGAQIARQLDLPRSSVHGLLAGLAAPRVLRKTGDNLFALGPQLMYWANGFLAKQDIVADFQTAIAAMPQLQPYTLTLSALDEDQVVYLACRNSNAPLGFTFRAGMQLPAVLTATGKSMLATFSDEEVRNIVKAFPEPLTETSVPDMPQLLAELAEARKRGYALDNGQVRLGMYCVGTALTDGHGRRYGIAVSLTKQEADAAVVALVTRHLQDLAAALQADLGSLAPHVP